MPQQTNLNVSPYFDDFDKGKNFQKVLFKPSYPVQARELTGLQSIFQNQLENFGKNILKEGSVVIPGNFTYQNNVDCVKINSSFNGLPVSSFYSDLIGKKIKGQESGVVAQIEFTLRDSDSSSGNYVLFLNYLEDGGNNFENKTFIDGETLLLQTAFTATGTNVGFEVGQEFLSCIEVNANSTGSLASISEGVFFVRGFFVDVPAQTLALSDFSNQVSVKVGLTVLEEVISSDSDSSLFDNAKGFSNYTAPGADRLKISLILDTRSVSESNTSDFILLSQIESGIPRYYNTTDSQYNLIRDELAKRTYDESGNYVVNPYTFDIIENLNDKYQTLGLYKEGDTSPSGNTASESLITYKINPGKAYVNGYDVESIAPKFLDVEKPRTVETAENISIPFNAGNLIIVDNVFGSATIGLGTNQYIDLMNSRLGTDKTVAAGTTIGQARVYDYVPESSYEGDTSRMFLRLFDIDTFTDVTLSTAITLSTPAQIKGKTSNAVGYLKDSVSSSTNLTLYSVEGQFLDNERIIINGIDDGRLITSITDYSIRDVKSVYADSTVGISTFSADVKLESKTALAPAGTLFDVTGLSGGISTVTTGLNSDFIKLVKEGDIISYSSSDGSNTPIYNKVNSVSTGGTFFTISEITSVNGICNGSISTTSFQTTNVVRINSTIDDGNPGLITILDKPNISNVELNSTRVYQRRLFSNITVNGDSTLSIDLTGYPLSSDLYFVPFDEDDYVITYEDGTIENIRFDKFSLDTTQKIITFAGLSKSSGQADVITTVQNDKPNPKQKILNKASTLIVDKSSLTASGIGTTTLNDGLTYSQIYGLRVQDEEISLNVCDVVRVLAIYESSTTSDPTIPKLQLTGFSGPSNNNTDFIIGEVIEGRTSGAVGLIVERVDTDKIEFVYLNDTQFDPLEVIETKETNLVAQISKIFLEDKNILGGYSFDNGQTNESYEYGRIRRKTSADTPTKKLKIIFQNYTIPENDTGEFICANSYPEEAYKFDIPLLGTLRNSDLIDIRPRAKAYNIALNRSPFERDSKDLSFSGGLSNYNLVPGDSLRVTYSYYLGRIDKIILNPDGTFEVLQGTPSLNPVAPSNKENTLTLGNVTLRPYVFDIRDCNTQAEIHKRYRMQDISLLEERISRLERYTTLTLSEMKTESLIIKDSETGLDRFKSGFFVDNFTTNSFIDNSNPSNKCDISNGTCQPTSTLRNFDLQLGSQLISGVTDTFDPNADQVYSADLGSPGIQKRGDLVTLSHVDVAYDGQLDATETINIGPNNFWRGEITLTPSSDIWFDEISIETPILNENITEVEPQTEITVVENVTRTHPCYVYPARWHRRCARRRWKHWKLWHKWRYKSWWKKWDDHDDFHKWKGNDHDHKHWHGYHHHGWNWYHHHHKNHYWLHHWNNIHFRNHDDHRHHDDHKHHFYHHHD